MSARYVYGISFILALTAAYACWCRAPMIWDGAYQFNATLIMQRPYFYLTRFHTYFLWWPTVWASRCTTNITLLQSIYGIPFLIAPTLAVLLSWWMVRKHAPYLMIWVIFGVAAGSLPGQIFVINDSIFQQHLFWPIFMAMFVPLSIPKKIVIGFLAIFQFVHPLGILLFLAAGCAATVLGVVRSDRRILIRAGVMVGLCALALGKIFITNHITAVHDTYAADEARWSTAIDRWGAGVKGWPLHGLWFMWAAAAMLFFLSHYRGRLTRDGMLWLTVILEFTLALMAFKYRNEFRQITAGATACILFYLFLLQYRRPNGPHPAIAILPFVCVAVGAGCWIYWASDGHLWWKAIDYRRWVGPLTAPFFVLATLDACADAILQRRKARIAHSGRALPIVGSTLPKHSHSHRVSAAAPGLANDPLLSDARFRNALALSLAILFAVVLRLQSTEWHLASTRMMTAVRQYPATIVPESALPWIQDTPLDHWAVSDYVMAMQGKQPKKLLLDRRSEERMYENPPQFPHWDFYPYAKKDHPDPRPGPVGWFDLRPLLHQVSLEPRPVQIKGGDRQDIQSTPN